MAEIDKDFLIRVRADIQQGVKELKRLTGEVKDTGKHAKQSANDMGKMEKGMDRLVKLGAAYLSLRMAQQLILQADAWTQLQARIKNATRETGDYVKVSRQLYDVSNQNGAAMRDTVDVFQRLSLARQDLGATNDQLIQLTDNVQKLGAVSGATDSALSAGLLQFGQGLSAGVFRAEEFNSIIENMPAVAKAIATGLGKSTGELRKMVIDGKLLSKDVMTALLGQTADIAKQFAELPDSVRRSGQSLSNSFARFLSQLDQAANGTGNLAKVMQLVTQSLDNWADRLGETELDRLMRERGEAMNYYQQLVADGADRQGKIMVDLLDKINALDTQIIAANRQMAKQQQIIKEAGGTISPEEQKRLETIKKLVKALEDQAATEGKTKEQTALNKLENLKASEADLQRARAAIAATQAEREAQSLRQQGQQVYEQTRTQAERYNAELERLNTLLLEGVINEETFARALNQATVEYSEFTDQAIEDTERLKAAQRGWMNSFSQGVADMVVDGKAQWKDMSKAIIKDLIRIWVYQQLVGLAGPGPGPQTAPGTSPTPVQSYGPGTAVAHGGGQVGSLTTRRNVSPYVFAGARRYHRGGTIPGLRSGEVPIIAEQGEEVLTRHDPRHSLNGGGMKNVSVVIENKGGAKEVTDSTAQVNGKDMIISVVVEDIKRGGSIDFALSSTGRGRNIR